MIHNSLRGGLICSLSLNESVISGACGGQGLIVGNERLLRFRQGGVGCLGGFDLALAFEGDLADGVDLSDHGLGC